MSIPARLLFIGMWNYACDNGHLDDKPKQIKMRIFPADDIDVSPMLEEMVNLGRITRADRYITIPKFAEHQRPHKRWFLVCDKPGCNRPDGSEPPERNRGKGGTTGPSNSGATVAQPLTTSDHGRSPADGDGDGDGDVSSLRGDADASAQTLIAEWIDHCEQRPPGRVIGHTSREIKNLLKEGIPYEHVRSGLAAWHEKRQNPSALASFVHQTRNPPEQRRNGTDSRVNDHLHLVQQFQNDNAPQIGPA